MPYLSIHTNQTVEADKAASLIDNASKKVAQLLSKPERYVMVNLVQGASLIFAGGAEPAAYVELKSIGLPESQTQQLSHAICAFLKENLDIDPERIYIDFSDIPRKFWGWNGSTF